MTKTELQELKNKPVAELEGLLKDGRAELRNLRFDLSAGKLKNITELRKVRKNIARILTFLHDGRRTEKKTI